MTLLERINIIDKFGQFLSILSVNSPLLRQIVAFVRVIFALHYAEIAKHAKARCSRGNEENLFIKSTKLILLMAKLILT